MGKTTGLDPGCVCGGGGGGEDWRSLLKTYKEESHIMIISFNCNHKDNVLEHGLCHLENTQ